MLSAFSAHALPQNFTVEGRLYDSLGTPLNDTNVTVMLEVLVVNPNDNASLSCVIYRETHTNVNVASPDPSSIGVFALRLGTGALNFPATAPSFAQIFSPGTFSGNSDGSATANCSVAAQDSYIRLIRTSIKTATVTSYEALVPDTRVSPVPQAFIAETANTIGTYGTADLLIANGSSANLTQDHLLNVFSTANYSTLLNLLSSGSASFGSRTISSVGTPLVGSDATNKSYVDANLGGQALNVSAVGTSGDGDTLQWSVSANGWVAKAFTLPNTAVTAQTYGSPTRFTSFTVGADGRLTNAVDYPLTSVGSASGDLTGNYPAPLINANAVTTAKIADGAITSLKLNATAPGVNRLVITDGTTGNNLTYATCTVNQIMVWSGSGWICNTVASLSAVTSVAGKSGAVTLNASDINYLGSAALLNWGTAAGQVVALNGTAQLPAVDGSLLLNVNAKTLAATNYQAVGYGLVGGSVVSQGSISVNAGNSANQIVAENSNAQISQAAGSVSIPSYSFSNNLQTGFFSPAAGKLSLASNGTAALTVDTSANVGIGTTIPMAVLDVYGTGAAASAMIVPRDTQSNRPAIGVNGMLRYNTSIGALESFAANSWQAIASGTSVGTMQKISTGVGLLGGPITSIGTISANVGAGAAQLVQENGAAQIAQSAGSVLAPAYSFGSSLTSGMFSPSLNNISLVTNGTAALVIDGVGRLGIGSASPNVILDVNGLASQSAILIPRDSTSNRPTGINGMLRYNTSTAQFEFFQTNAWVTYNTGSSNGTVVNVSAGSGLLGGVVTSSGTLSVNAGTGAGQIPQLSLNGQLTVDNGTPTNPTLTFTNSSNAGIYSPDINKIAITTSGTAALTVSSSGYVGIGTLNPMAVLDINSAGTSSAILLPRNTQANRPTGINGMIRYNTSSNVMEAFANGNWVNVANGTSPGTVVSVSTGSGLLGGPITSNGTISVNSGTGALQIVAENSTAQIAQNAGSVAAPAYSFSSSPTSGLFSPILNNISLVTNGTAALTIDGFGRLGIGSASPNVILDVNGSASQSAILIPRDSTANRPTGINGMLRYNTSKAQFEFFQLNNWVTYNTGSTNGTVVSIAAGSGLLGGTITSSGTLSVDVGNTANQIVQENSSGQILQQSFGNASLPVYSFVGAPTTGLFYTSGIGLAISVSGTSALSFNTSGSANFANGVSSSGGSSAAYVANSSTATSAAVNQLFLNNNATTDGAYSGLQMLTSNAAGTFQSGYVGLVSQSGTNASNLVFGHQTGPNAVAEVMRLDYRGFVGIGTTIPGAALDVNVIGTASAIIVPRDTNLNRPSPGVPGMIRYSTTNNNFEFFQNGAWANLSGVNFPLQANPGTATASAPTYTFYNNSTTGMFLTPTKILSFATAGTSALSIDATQNVSIGTSSANGYLLNVDGGSSAKSLSLKAGSSTTGVGGDILLTPGAGTISGGMVRVSGSGLALGSSSTLITQPNTTTPTYVDTSNPLYTLLGTNGSCSSTKLCLFLQNTSFWTISISNSQGGATLSCIQSGIPGQHLYLNVNNQSGGNLSTFVLNGSSCGVGFAPIQFNATSNSANLKNGSFGNYMFIYDGTNWQLFSER